jgi:hypothetical protein
MLRDIMAGASRGGHPLQADGVHDEGCAFALRAACVGTWSQEWMDVSCASARREPSSPEEGTRRRTPQRALLVARTQ